MATHMWNIPRINHRIVNHIVSPHFCDRCCYLLDCLILDMIMFSLPREQNRIEDLLLCVLCWWKTEWEEDRAFWVPLQWPSRTRKAALQLRYYHNDVITAAGASCSLCLRTSCCETASPPLLFSRLINSLPSFSSSSFLSIIDHVSIIGFFGTNISNLVFQEMRRSNERLESVVSGAMMSLDLTLTDSGQTTAVEVQVRVCEKKVRV